MGSACSFKRNCNKLIKIQLANYTAQNFLKINNNCAISTATYTDIQLQIVINTRIDIHVWVD